MVAINPSPPFITLNKKVELHCFLTLWDYIKTDERRAVCSDK